MERISRIGEGVDRLVNVDLGSRGIVYKLYDAARDLAGAPLMLTAASRIKEVTEPEDFILIATGFRLPPNFIQETDGPLGAAALAKSLNVALGVKPILLIEEDSTGVLKACLQAIGMKVVESKKLPTTKQASTVLSFPLDSKDATEKAKTLLEEYVPTAAVAVEKAGMNKKGVYHNAGGLNISAQHAKIEELFKEARKRGILTIGIGDGGNEIGMGNIRETVEEFVPRGLVCRCPCEGGIAADSQVDVLVVSAVSNWGCYGIEACLASLAGKPEALHTPALEDAMLAAAVDAKAIDGRTGLETKAVDGNPAEVHLALMTMLKQIISVRPKTV